MIKGTATIEFGNGSNMSSMGVDLDTGYGLIFMRSTTPGKMGLDTGRFTEEDLQETVRNAEVSMYFTNTESLDVWIAGLVQLKKDMESFNKGEEVSE